MRILTLTLVMALASACTIYFGDGDDTPPHHPAPDAQPTWPDGQIPPDGDWSPYPDASWIPPDGDWTPYPDAQLIPPDGDTTPYPDAGSGCGSGSGSGSGSGGYADAAY